MASLSLINQIWIKVQQQDKEGRNISLSSPKLLSITCEFYKLIIDNLMEPRQ